MGVKDLSLVEVGGGTKEPYFVGGRKVERN